MSRAERRSRREEAKKATELAKKYSKPGSVPRRQEGRGRCKVCHIDDGHAGWCPRNS